ncbi:MAG TPA: LuxR C-terminal-related transcriptional regulator [Candidatus Dormibacteraeota bacterium]|jgi:DNA-binding CsgD family transcriptional regulator|nr:LuxR C-terminal-related transcriptional regulator [Candidatus Dormibacteraeota bacterium]
MHASLTKLGASDLVLLLELIEQSLVIKNGTEMGGLLGRLSRHLPTEGVIAGLVPAQADSIKTEEVPFVNVGYSDEWLKEYLRNDYFSCDPIKRARLSGVDFMRWSDTFAKAEKNVEKHYIRQAREYNIHEGVTIGAHRTSSGPVSFFSFIGINLANNERDQAILRHISPYLHEAMCRATPATPAVRQSPLSGRETEVLSWAMVGKTNWEISMILSISERTVKFHIQNVMGKLHASSRAHAVAIALGQGLICS